MRLICLLPARLILTRTCNAQLLSFWQTRESCTELDTLHDMLRLAAMDVKREIDLFLDKIISKYGKRLASASKRNPMDVGRMLQWGIFERDHIERLQNKLHKGKNIVLLVQSQASMVQEERNRDVVFEKMSALTDAEEAAAAKLDKRLEDLEEKADKQLEKLDQIVDCLGDVSLAVAPFASLATDLPGTLSKVLSEKLAQRTPFNSFDPYFQNCTIVEDSLGWKIRIPLEIITSWNTFHSILVDKFEGRPGLQLVKDRRYVFRDDLTGVELHQIAPLSSVLRPGQKINMCMVFFASTESTSTCPRCCKPTLQLNSNDLRCTTPRCEMEIQRIEEIIDEDQIQSFCKKPAPMEVTTSDQYKDTNDTSTVDGLPATLPFQPEDGPEVFKRVRFFSRWEHRFESRGSLLWRGDQYSFWRATAREATIIRKALATMLRNPSYAGGKTRLGIESVCALHTVFIGPSIEQSKLMLGVFCMERKRRIKIVKRLKEVEWIKANPSIMVVGHCSPVFLEGPLGLKAWIGWWNARLKKAAMVMERVGG